jgi:ADP-ribose pyrophosphatase YjhB (NUDIX family)
MEKVVVAFIKKQEPERYLLVSSKRDFGEFTGFYYPAGGHVNHGENLVDALKRELLEELQLEIINPELIEITEGDVKDQETYWYKCDLLNPEKILIKEEIVNDGLQDARFFTIEEIKKLNLWPATRKVLGKLIGI